MPDLIGRYRIESMIGRGAMGVIYRAHDPEIDRSVAIKLVRADLLSGNDRSDYIARFRREAQAAGRYHLRFRAARGQPILCDGVHRRP
jgi:serine/threonine-protein kinase